MAAQPAVKSKECNEFSGLGPAKWWSTQTWMLETWLKSGVHEIAVQVLRVKGKSTTQPFTALNIKEKADIPSITSSGEEKERKVAGFTMSGGSVWDEHKG